MVLHLLTRNFTLLLALYQGWIDSCYLTVPASTSK